jgi:predicted TPR repeat methyltransferase
MAHADDRLHQTDALYKRGNELYRLGRMTEALASLDAALALWPAHPGALLSRGAAQCQLGYFEAALKTFDRLLALQPRSVDALYNRGVALFALQRWPEALASYDRALALQPQRAAARLNRGMTLQKLGQPIDALASIDQALAIQPDYVEALNNRGIALQSLDRQNEALASFDRALALRPDDIETLCNRGNTLEALDRPADALRDFDRALALRPGFADAWSNRSTALRRLDRWPEALASVDRALAIRPDYPEALNHRGITLRKLNRQPEAITAFRHALTIQPGVAQFHANLGIALLELGQLEAGEKSLRQALQLQKSAAVFQNLAVALYQQQKPSEAMQIYRDWLAFEPDNPVPQHMAAAGSDTAPKRAGDQYVAGLFDSFAKSFETTLLGLGYRVPELLTAQIGIARGTDTSPLRILDAGCGTGLAAPLLKPLASQLVGVDLSSGMLAKARERKLYDELVVAELCAFMASRPAAFDLVLLADTLVYFGALEEAFSSAHSTLTPGGIFAFAVESRAECGPDYQLELHGRYSHRPDYLTRLLATSGYTICTTDTVVIRRELNTDVPGVAVVARRDPD